LTELTETLSRLVKTESAAGVLLRVPGAASFERVHRVVNSIRAAGVKAIRLAPTTDKSGAE
jgi:biopolymer transport protein ExbD